MNEESRLKADFFAREEARKEIEEIRKSPIGQFVLRMYEEMRTAKMQ